MSTQQICLREILQTNCLDLLGSAWQGALTCFNEVSVRFQVQPGPLERAVRDRRTARVCVEDFSGTAPACIGTVWN